MTIPAEAATLHCALCGNGLVPWRPGQTTHPMCDPAEADRIREAAANPPAPPLNGAAGHTDPDQHTSYVDRLRANLIDTAGLDSIGDPEPLITGVVQLDSIAWIGGRPGSAKTLVALDMAGAVGTGQPWQTIPVRKGSVLYLIAEGARGIRKRVRAWEAANDRPMTGVTFLPVAVQAASELQWNALCELAADLKPALIVIDTQARVTVGMEENSNKDMGVFVDRLERLRRACAACVLVLHHTPRGSDNLRGATAMEGAATTIIMTVMEGDTVTLINAPEEGGKQKDFDPFDPINLRLIPTDRSVILALTDRPQRTDTNSKAVRDLLSRWWALHESDEVSVSVLIKSGACSEATFHRSKKALIADGFVAKEGKGNQVRYRLLRDPSS
jgi:hypothetical protein